LTALLYAPSRTRRAAGLPPCTSTCTACRAAMLVAVAALSWAARRPTGRGMASVAVLVSVLLFCWIVLAAQERLAVAAKRRAVTG